MKKQNQNQAQDQVQHQNQAEHQIQAQAQEGGVVAMKEPQNRLYFITFVTKLDPQTSRQVLVELRRKFPTMKPVFTPVPPPGRRMILNINGIVTILSFPRNQNRQEETHNQNPTGFTLRELIKIKKP